jgi:hypothetical protein
LSAGRLAVPVAAMLAVGLVAWLLVGIFSGGGKPAGKPAAAASPPGKTTPSGAPSSNSTAPSHSGAPLQVVRPGDVKSFNPFNSPPGDDNAADVGLAADGNPSTVWKTDPYRGYANFGNLKAGSGLIFDMGSAVTIRQVRISTPTPGISLRVLAADSPGQQPTAMKVAGSKSKAGSSLTVSTSAGGAHRYWVVWLTGLAPTQDGQFQGAISEVHFLR